MYFWNTNQFVLCWVLSNVDLTAALDVDEPHSTASERGESRLKVDADCAAAGGSLGGGAGGGLQLWRV